MSLPGKFLFLKFDFIGIEIDPLNSDFDSEPDSDLDYPMIKPVMWFRILSFSQLTGYAFLIIYLA